MRLLFCCESLAAAALSAAAVSDAADAAERRDAAALHKLVAQRCQH